MARNNKLQEESERRGVPLDELIPRLVEEKGGVMFAAVDLGVYPATVQRWLDKHDLKVQVRRVVEVVKVEEVTA